LGRIFPAGRSLGRGGHSSCATGFHLRLQSLLSFASGVLAATSLPGTRHPEPQAIKASLACAFRLAGPSQLRRRLSPALPQPLLLHPACPQAPSCPGSGASGRDKVSPAYAFRLAGPPELCRRLSLASGVPSFASGAPAAASLSGSRSFGP